MTPAEWHRIFACFLSSQALVRYSLDNRTVNKSTHLYETLCNRFAISSECIPLMLCTCSAGLCFCHLRADLLHRLDESRAHFFAHLDACQNMPKLQVNALWTLNSCTSTKWLSCRQLVLPGHFNCPGNFLHHPGRIWEASNVVITSVQCFNSSKSQHHRKTVVFSV